MSQTGSTSRTVGSLGSSTDSTVGSVNNQKGDFGNKHRKIIRILTVVAYIMSVSTAALLLSAYYVFLWDPKEPDLRSLTKRPTDYPSTMAHHGFTNYPNVGGSNNNGGGYMYSYNNRHISSALNAPYPSDATPKTTRSSRKGYNSNYYTKPTSPQIPTPQSLIMEKLILTSTTPSHRTEPLGLGVGSQPDDPKGTKSIWVTTPKTLGF